MGAAESRGPQPAPAPVDGASATTTVKTVTYNASGHVVACLFCRIADGREPGGAPLWYADSLVSAFVPRTPAAALHFLVVPRAHVRNTDALTADDAPLLRHMAAVGRQLLREHGGAALAARGGEPLPRCAPPPPPGAYPHHRDALAHDAHDVVDAPSWRLHFHVPPFNSVDHLHLHALHTPFTTCADRVTFLHGAPWTGGVDDATAAALSRPRAQPPVAPDGATSGATAPRAPAAPHAVAKL